MGNGTHEQHTRLAYRPGLDGFRGAALGAVLLFHGGFGWAKGGFLGVTAFFVLSGFLITSLLLVEREATGRIDLRAFWTRRARRLVPAALLTLPLVALYAVLAQGSGRGVASGIAGDAAAAAGWVANWRFVLDGQSYADLFSEPSPFQHFWSLAIEEQFYVVLPLAAVFLFGRRGGRANKARLAAAAALTLVASTAAAAIWHDVDGATRAYYGTDARVAEPLVGVLLALLVTGRKTGERWRRILDVAAVPALIGLALLIGTAGVKQPFLYRGGLLLTALLAAVLVAGAAQPGTWAARLFSAPPLVAVGRISYGAYLFHWPVFLLLTPERTGLEQVPLFFVRTAATLALAMASYAVVEQPVRSGRLRGRVGALAWANATVAALAAVVLATAAAPATDGRSTFLAAAGPVAPPPSWSSGPSAAQHSSAPTPPPADTTTSAPALTTSSTAKPAAPGRKPATTAPAPSATTPTTNPPPQFSKPAETPKSPTTTTPAPEAKPRLKVAVVGDSMAKGLGEGLAAWAEEQGDVAVYNMAINSCPISRGGTRRILEDGDFPIAPVCRWWADDASETWKFFAEFDPDVVVVHDGLNEAFDRWLDEWDMYRKPGDATLDRWLVDEYKAAIGRLTSLGAVSVFLDTPCVHWKRMRFHGYEYGSGDQRVARLNNLAGDLGEQGYRTAALHRHLCPNGGFTDTVDDVEDARPDGYHLSEEAAVAVAKSWLGPLVTSAVPRP